MADTITIFGKPHEYSGPTDGGTVERPLYRKRNLLPCETPGCSENCAYAYSCHEKRMGRHAIFWPGIALVALFAIAAIL